MQAKKIKYTNGSKLTEHKKMYRTDVLCSFSISDFSFSVFFYLLFLIYIYYNAICFFFTPFPSTVRH